MHIPGIPVQNSLCFVANSVQIQNERKPALEFEFASPNVYGIYPIPCHSQALSGSSAIHTLFYT